MKHKFALAGIPVTVVRSTVVTALLAAQLTVLGLVVLSVRGGSLVPAFAQHRNSESAAAQISEGGAHRIFDSRGNATLTVDIGYADVTFETSKTSRIDVSVSPSTSFGLFAATGAITATADGENVRISALRSEGWSMGDDRMVTVIVPPETRVTVLAAGNIKATGLRAEASFKSVGHGSITVDDYRAPKLAVVTSNGRIHLNDVVATHLDATGGDGRVEGTELLIRDGDVESDGRVRLGFAAGADTRITAQASNGKVSVSGLPEGASVTTSSGNAENDGDDDHSSFRTVRIGNGAGHLNVHSNDGNITLSQDR